MSFPFWLVESEKVTKFDKIYKLKKEIGRRWYQPVYVILKLINIIF